MEGDINAELQYASPFMRGIIDLGHDMSTTGIDPSTAMVIVAAVPVTLRVLRMANELSSAAVSDWSEGKRLERKKQELEIEHKAHERKIASEIRPTQYKETRGEPTEAVALDITQSAIED